MKTTQVKIGLVIGILFIFLAGTAWAGNRFHERQHTQAQKIDRGLSAGSITQKEYIRLNREQCRIQQAENRALSDGEITQKERMRLRHMQDNAARHIYQANHNEYTQQ